MTISKNTMKTILKIFIFIALILCSMAAYSPIDDMADWTMQMINDALSQGDCDRAQRSYKSWKVLTEKTNSAIESRIAECKDEEVVLQREPELKEDITLEEPKEFYWVLFYLDCGFDFDKNWKRESSIQLDELAETMKEHPKAKFQLDGHTDDRSSDALCMELSQRYCDFIKDRLIERGIPTEKMIVIPHGKRELAIPNAKNEAEHEQNCRVEITMIKNTTTNSPTYDEGVVINGVKWATRNVDKPGTFAEKPEDAGMFYQWNRKKSWTVTDSVTDWDSTTPTGNSWEAINDPSPSGWRIPTNKELQKLLDPEKVASEWVTQNGITSRKFTERTTGNTLFLPAAGLRNSSDGTLFDAGTSGGYWSSTAHKSVETGAHYLYVGSGNSVWLYHVRCYGFSVRCVAE